MFIAELTVRPNERVLIGPKGSGSLEPLAFALFLELASRAGTLVTRHELFNRLWGSLAVGDDNLFHGERYKWSLTLTAINVTNKVALYNFLSTFSGTHYVTPRALTAEIGFHF